MQLYKYLIIGQLSLKDCAVCTLRTCFLKTVYYLLEKPLFMPFQLHFQQEASPSLRSLFSWVVLISYCSPSDSFPTVPYKTNYLILEATTLSANCMQKCSLQVSGRTEVPAYLLKEVVEVTCCFRSPSPQQNLSDWIAATQCDKKRSSHALPFTTQCFNFMHPRIDRSIITRRTNIE